MFYFTVTKKNYNINNIENRKFNILFSLLYRIKLNGSVFAVVQT